MKEIKGSSCVHHHIIRLQGRKIVINYIHVHTLQHDDVLYPWLPAPCPHKLCDPL